MSISYLDDLDVSIPYPSHFRFRTSCYVLVSLERGGIREKILQAVKMNATLKLLADRAQPGRCQ